MKTPRRILVLNVTRIGDTLLTTPVLRALATAWPEARITFAGHAKRIEILRNLPFVHELRAISRQGAGWRGHLTREKYDLALVYGFDRPLIDYALRVSERVIAFRQPDHDVNRRLFAVGGEDGYQPTHAVTWLLQLVRPLGITPAGFNLSYVVTAEEDAHAHAELERADIRGAQPLIGLQVASFPTKRFRDWPIDHFAELCRKILQFRPASRFVIFGGPEDVERTSQLAGYFGDAALSYAGRLSLRQTAAIMNQLDLYVGVDTGPTHIMGALGRPMVAFYHPTSPSRALAPLEHPCCHAIDHPLADSPAATTETPIAEIGVDLVWRHARSALSGTDIPTPMQTIWT